MLDLDVVNCLSKYPSKLSQGADVDFWEVPFLELSWYKNKYFRKAWGFFGVFATEVLDKEAADSWDMILEDVCGSDFITDQFINHLKIIETLIFAFKGTHWQPIDFAVVIGSLPTVDTPSKLATLNVALVDLIYRIKLKFSYFFGFRIGNDWVVSDLVLRLNWGFNCNLVK